MRRVPVRHVVLGLALALGLATPVGLSAPVSAVAWDTDAFEPESEVELVALTNRTRAAAGLPELVIDARLVALARWRSRDMVERAYFSHDLPDGGTVFDVLSRRRYCFRLAGENIGWNTWSDPEATRGIHGMFLESPGHRRNVEGTDWDAIGVGAYKGPDGRKVWTVLFADACDRSPIAAGDGGGTVASRRPPGRSRSRASTGGVRAPRARPSARPVPSGATRSGHSAGSAPPWCRWSSDSSRPAPEKPPRGRLGPVGRWQRPATRRRVRVTIALPRMNRLPAAERGITIGDFLVPIRLGETLSARVRHAVLILVGALFVALTAQITIRLPIGETPIPLTGQTFGVLLVGGALGLRRGAIALLLYLAMGLVLPVYAPGGASGVARFVTQDGGQWVLGATGGYLVGFVFAAALVGWLAEMGWDRRLIGAIGAMVLGNLVIYSLGTGWLMAATGADLGTGVAQGVRPFLLADAIKVVAAAVLFPAAWWIVGHRPGER